MLLGAFHTPGKLSSEAGWLSRNFDSNIEWSLDKQIFYDVSAQFFSPEIDLFASCLNNKVPRFYSWLAGP